jgi:hypothetical protein
MKLSAIVGSSFNQFWRGTLEPARNNKHMVRTDTTVMDLLEGNGWLDSKTWSSSGVNVTRKIHRGIYLICGGTNLIGHALLSIHTRIQYLVLQSCSGVQSWDPLGRILRVCLVFEEAVQVPEEIQRLAKQSGIDNVLTTCCIHTEHST